MRRLVMVVVLALVAALVFAPQVSGTVVRSVSASGKPTAKPVRETSKKTCPKLKKGKKPKGSCAKAKKTKPKRHPKATAVPSRPPTSTSTRTPVPSASPTATDIPPSEVSVHVRAIAQTWDQAAFYACGMPNGVTASFNPRSATAQPDNTSPSYASAASTLTLSTSHSVEPNSYPIALYARFKDSQGTPVPQLPVGGYVEPRAVLLTVNPDGSTRISATTTIPITGSCSSAPDDFLPAPTATPAASEIHVQAWVSDTHPVAGENVIVHGSLTVRGQPAFQVLMTANWFLPHGVSSCYGYSQADGVASCSLDNANPIPGYPVQIEVNFMYNGSIFSALTSYTM